jgi:hypothetical protein
MYGTWVQQLEEFMFGWTARRFLLLGLYRTCHITTVFMAPYCKFSLINGFLCSVSHIRSSLCSDCCRDQPQTVCYTS